MKLIVGLGNPGDEYAHTRHNVGFDAIDLVAEDLPGTPYWKSEGGALCAHVRRGDEEVILCKPQSFMNASGGPVATIMRKYAIDPSDLIIIHDDLDLPVGTIRVKSGGGLGGHNGLRSIEQKLGGRDWTRVKVGIDHPPGRKSVTDHVLSRPRKDEADSLQEAIGRAAHAAQFLLDHSVIEAQNHFN